MYSMAIGVPSISIWGLGLPFVLLVYMLMKGERMHSHRNFARFKVITQGFRSNCFWWEYVNTSKKLFLIGVNVFCYNYPAYF